MRRALSSCWITYAPLVGRRLDELLRDVPIFGLEVHEDWGGVMFVWKSEACINVKYDDKAANCT